LVRAALPLHDALPIFLGMTRRGEQIIPLIGLPGYPVSGILVLEQLIKPVIGKMTARQLEPHKFVEATVSRRLVSSLKYLEFIRRSEEHTSELQSRENL